MKILFSLFIFAHSLLFSITSNSQNVSKIDSLNKLLKKEKIDTVKFSIYNQLYDEYRFVDPSEAKLIAEEALEYAKKQKNYNEMSDALRWIGDANLNMDNYQIAIEYIEKSLDQSKKDNYKLGTAKAYSLLGFAYFVSANYDTSVYYYQKAIESFEAIDEIKRVANNYLLQGNSYFYKGDYYYSINAYENSLNLAQQLSNKRLVTQCLTNMGNIHASRANYQEALKNYVEALREFDNEKNSIDFGDLNNNIGLVYQCMNNYEKAEEYYNIALKTYNVIGNKNNLLNVYLNFGTLYSSKKEYETSINYLKILDTLATSLDNTHYKAKGDYQLGIVSKEYYKNYSLSNKYFHKALDGFVKIGDKSGEQVALKDLAKNFFYNNDYVKALNYNQKSLILAEENKNKEEIKSCYQTFAQIYESLGEYKKAYNYYVLYKETHDSIFNHESNRLLYELETKFQLEQKEQQIILQESMLAQKESEIKNQKIIRNALIGGIIAFFLIVILISSAYIIKRKANIKISRQKDIIEKEREKSEKLLLNILPKETATELKEKGIATPKEYDNVTVFFSDLINFISISESLEPSVVVSELNEIFTAFDEIMEKHKCERIKTIGDAYLAVCGMPIPDEKHAFNLMNASTEIIDYMNERANHSKIKWQIRIGVHTGKVVGGIIGIKKYIYDIFGDTINTASRMESNSEAMKINISENTYKIIKDSYQCNKREAVDIKGKGKMNMYFVELKI